MDTVSPLLSRPGAVAGSGHDAGVAWHYGDPAAEQRALAAGNAVADLSHTGLIRVSGPDRLSWLHSITSQDVADLPPHTSTELLVLSPHGHVEHAAGLVDDGEASWLLVDGPAGALADWLNSMRFALRVEVADVSNEFAVIGEPVDEEGPIEDDGAVYPVWRDMWPRVRDGGTRYGASTDLHPGVRRAWRLVVVPRRALEDVIARREADGARLVGTWACEALRIEAWRPRLSAEVDHRTIPHELDWLRTAVHLSKGCYRGQETVARVHNLGKPPRRLVLLHLDGSESLLPEPGATVHSVVEAEAGREPGRAIGTITSAARHHEWGPIALALIKRSVSEDDDLLVDCEGVPVAAVQETIVPAEGVSVDRPQARGPLARGLGGPSTGALLGTM